MSLHDASDPAVTFGLFDWVDADGVREPGQLYRERLDLLTDAEAQGFDIYHVAEHHGTPLGLVPSPGVFLAAAATATTRIRLSPLVYVLPLYHPVRLAEEIAMLDQLSGGRLEVGVGKGGNPYELLAYGIEPGEARQRYDETLDSLMRILATGTVDARGSTELPLRVRQAPHPPIWYPTSNPESIPLLGTRGINTVLGFSFISPTTDVIDEGRVIAGSAGTVRERLTEMLRVTGCNHFAGAFAFGSLSLAEARSSLARFGEQVAPALRAPGAG